MRNTDVPITDYETYSENWDKIFGEKVEDIEIVEDLSEEKKDKKDGE